MQRLHRSVAALALCATHAFGQAAPPAPAAPAASTDATDLSILYAGAPGGEREKRFVEFLEAWFPEVQTISLEELSPKSAEGFDVVVADWKSRYKNGNYQQDADPKVRLDPRYSKPTICISSVGTAICGGKLDWL